jgi:cystathionine beta-synthase
VVLGEIAGAVHEDELLDGVFAGKVNLSDEVGGLIGRPLPLVGVNEPVGTLRAALADETALLVTDGGKALGVVSRSDLLDYLAV